MILGYNSELSQYTSGNRTIIITSNGIITKNMQMYHPFSADKTAIIIFLVTRYCDDSFFWRCEMNHNSQYCAIENAELGREERYRLYLIAMR